MLAIALAATGCFAKGDPFSPYDPIFEGEGRLYVYRPAAFANSGGEMNFVLNGKALATLRNDGYVSVSLKPDEYALTAEWPTNIQNLESVTERFRQRAGRAIFCRYKTSTNVVTISWRLDCGESEETHAAIRGCKKEPFEPGMGWSP